MKRGIIILGVSLLTHSIYSCEKKNERPSEYEVDLFANERGANKAYIMNRDEAKSASVMVLATSNIKVSDSSNGRGKDFYIYKVNSAEIVKTTLDSTIVYPFSFISEYKLKINKENKSPLYIYLENLKGYKFIAEERNIHYQWLKGAPIYKVE